MSDSFATLWTVACQAPLTMEFSRQEYWSGLPFLLQGIFLTQASNPHLLDWQADSLPLKFFATMGALRKANQFCSVQSLSRVRLFVTP